MRDAINQLYVKHCNQEIKNVGMRSLYFVQPLVHSSKFACPGFPFFSPFFHPGAGWSPNLARQGFGNFSSCDAETAVERDTFMSANEAMSWGLIDNVLLKRESLESGAEKN
jgi:hypothetical protein